MAEPPLRPGSAIGILGGGQLGRMLTLSAAQLGLDARIYCEKPDAPSFRVATSHVCAPFTDEAALIRFARSCDVVTFEFENVPVEALEIITRYTPVFPSPSALRVIQDRGEEKAFLSSLGIPIADFCTVDSEAGLQDAIARIGRPSMLKTRRFGYDGKGQVRINGDTNAAKAWRDIAAAPAVLEAFVPFEREVSVVAARGQDGESIFYDLTENRHENQILAESRVPARVAEGLETEGHAIVRKVLDALDYVGVLAVEMFVCNDGGPRLLANEIAPRVHNSGHWTLDGCGASQFEAHVRAVAGWPLPSSARHSDAVMTNLIGADAERWHDLAADPANRVHLYGKSEARPGRKMGHVTRILPLGTLS
ncbi:MAG: 5-(carboxyamino)imidazole ribonucleotide synthase [Pseudomonadota bacterium]|nr:5-(carboxyamino)imidazole ribonucleotide synthase [Pseudomonadota bacterium]